MTVEEAYKILIDSKMAKLQCNFKVEKTKTGGNHNGRKPGSKNKLTLKSLDKKIDLSIKSLDAKVNNLSNDIKEVRITLAKLAQIVQEGFAQVNARIDNLVIKNNLKE